jgi:hypothetical protein
MIWKVFKSLITAICLSFATLILIIAPFNFGIFGFACFLVFMGSALWIDFTKPQDSQNITPTQRNLAKVAIWGLGIIFTIMFISSFFSSDTHVNSRGFVQIITALLKAL